MAEGVRSDARPFFFPIPLQAINYLLQEFGSSKNLSYLPNPKGIRTADFIFERKGVYKLYDLKTIIGRSSVSNRLLESIGQANRVLLNMVVDYNPIALARNVKSYFEKNPKAVEVLIFKGHKCISVLREDVQSKTFHKLFIAKYIK